MRKIRELLRLGLDQRRSLREISISVGIGRTAAGELLRRAEQAGLGWPLPAEIDDTELERRLHPGNQGRPRQRPEPDWQHVDEELRRGKGTTIELLWLEYRADQPDGYPYSQFCHHFAAWRRKVDVVLRQSHRAGERMFVDYAGPTVPLYQRRTDVVLFEASIFVAVLGASSFTFSEAQRAQDLPNWLAGHVHAFEFFGGVPEVVVPDNLKAGVRQPSFYEPDLHPSYRDLATHYGVTVIPARPRRPRDKAAVEVGVQVVERWILAVLRHRRFYGLNELNAAIAECLRKINARPFRKRDGSRQSLFEALDKSALPPLPPGPYVFTDWQRPKVNVDYHVQIDGNDDSVPYVLVGERLDARITETTVELLFKGQRVASHIRVRGRGQYITERNHRPRAHQAHLEWTPSRMIRWADSIGPKTAQLVETILAERKHPEHGYRTCLGRMRLAKVYPADRMDAAAARALTHHLHTYRSVKTILEKGLDQTTDLPEPMATVVAEHQNVRGADYYAAKRQGEQVHVDATDA